MIAPAAAEKTAGRIAAWRGELAELLETLQRWPYLETLSTERVKAADGLQLCSQNGRNKSAATSSNIGPKKHRAHPTFGEKLGTLKIPRSVPPRYGLTARISAKVRSSTPNSFGIPITWSVLFLSDDMNSI